MSRAKLAGRAAGDALALGGGLAASDAVTSPGPVLARRAEDVYVGTGGLDGAGNLVDGHIGDGDAGCRGAGRAAVLVVLLDNNTVLGNVGKSDAVILDVGDGSSGTRHGLDANTVVRVGDL